LPYFKVPLKEKRQSGLLMPTFGWRKDSGNIYSQPIYFTNSEQFDTTLTTELFEKRGTKVGVEMRYQPKQYSGLELKVEGIRDYLWLEGRRNREFARDFYFGNDGENIRSGSYCDDDDPN